MSEIIYCDAEKAVEVMGNRRVDTKLQARLYSYLGGNIAGGPFGENVNTGIPAVRAEYLARPTCGDLDFIRSATNTNLEPWTVSYRSDSYAKGTNPKKATMFRPPLALPKGQVVKLNVVDKSANKFGALGDMPTCFGIDLAEWWLKLREYQLAKEGLGDLTNNVYDIGDWYKAQAEDAGFDGRQDSRAAYYYPRLMGLYAARAVLFCDYDAFPSFTYAAPAADYASEELGVRPVIVRWGPYDQYAAKENPNRRLAANWVDLSDELGLTFDGLTEWLRSKAKCATSLESVSV